MANVSGSDVCFRCTESITLHFKLHVEVKNQHCMARTDVQGVSNGSELILGMCSTEHRPYGVIGLSAQSQMAAAIEK
jgi:hypothetical protein